MNVDVVESLRGGLWFHQNDGYYFSIYKAREAKLFLRCTTLTCPARAAFDITNGHFRRTSGDHAVHCNPRLYDAPAAQLINQMRKRLEQPRETSSIRKVYDQETAQAPHELVARIPYRRIRNTLYRSRGGRFKKPETLQDLSNFIHTRNPDKGKTIHGKQFLIHTSQSVLIFLSPNTRKLLKENLIFTMDGTFRCTPQKPRIYQLFTIGGLMPNGGDDFVFIPIVYAVMNSKMLSAYKWLFQKLAALPEEWKPTKMISDYETASTKAFLSVFPQCQIIGCWFHFCQRIRKKYDNLGMRPSLGQSLRLRTIIGMIMALPLLPPQLISEGFCVIVSVATELRIIDTKLEEVLSYINRFWLRRIGVSKLSVFESPIRTNNHQEAFHGHIMLHMGDCRNSKHPNIWQFLEGLKNIENIKAIQMLSVEKNNKEAYPKTPMQIFQNNNIRQASQLLSEGRITVQRFLERMLHTNNLHITPIGHYFDLADDLEWGNWQEQLILERDEAENEIEIEIIEIFI